MNTAIHSTGPFFSGQKPFEKFLARNPGIRLSDWDRAILDNLLSDRFGRLHTCEPEMDKMTGYASTVLAVAVANMPGLKKESLLQPFRDIATKLEVLLESLKNQHARMTEKETIKIKSCLTRTRKLLGHMEAKIP